MPASIEDCRDVGGSILGCGTGSRSGTAKSRAADCPGKPSFTPVVLALSLIASVEGGTARDPVPFPRDTASASLLRAVRVFCWNFNFSMRTTRLANRVRASRARQHIKHPLWLRRSRCIRYGHANIPGLALKPGNGDWAASCRSWPNASNPFRSLAHYQSCRNSGDTPRRP